MTSVDKTYAISTVSFVAIIVIFIIGQYVNYYIPEHRQEMSQDKMEFLFIVQTAMFWGFWIYIFLFTASLVTGQIKEIRNK